MTGTEDSSDASSSLAAKDGGEEVTTALSGSDLQSFHNWSQKNSRSVVAPLVTLLFLIAYVVLTVLALDTKALVGAVAAVVILATMVALAKVSARRRRSEFQDLAVVQSGRISVEALGLTFRSESEETRYDWVSFVDVVETAKHVYVRRTESSALVIPKRCFESREAAGRFADAVERQIAQGRRS
ncbi:MAG TPA: YcxB family protein [Acidimicrobiia bacterium]|jgi:hypothetical protein